MNEKKQTVNDLYDSKFHGAGAMKKSTGFKVIPTVLDPYALPNARDKLDPEHVAYFESCYLAGLPVDAIKVVQTPTDTGMLAVLEGRHRTHGALQALKRNPDIMVDVVVVLAETAFEQYGYMLDTDRRKPFTFLEQANATYAMKQLSPNLSTQQLADLRRVSKTAIENYIILGGAPEEVKDRVREGRISGSQAVEYVRDHGDKAAEAILADLERVANIGKGKVPGKGGAESAKYSHSKCLDAMEILLNVEYDVKQLAKDKGEVAFKLGVEDAKALLSIIEDYQLWLEG